MLWIRKKVRNRIFFDGENLSAIKISPGKTGSYISWHYLFDNKAYFTIGDSLFGTELCIYNILEDEFEMVDLNPGSANSYPAFFLAYQNQLIFSATGQDTGRESVIFDGNEFRFIDVIPDKTGSSPYYYKEFDGRIYFIAKDGIHGRELHVYDGEEAMMVADIKPGP